MARQDPTTPQADLTNSGRVFGFLVLYRWLSLLPVVLAMAFSADQLGRFAGALAASVTANLIITLFPARLNAALGRSPWLLALDFLFCGAIAGLTGGWTTPAYLYTLSPILAAAFFFQLRGALIAAVIMAMLMFIAGMPDSALVDKWQALMTYQVGYLLIAGTFGYATNLVSQLQAAHMSVSRAHRDLEVIHSLNLSLQSAVDVEQVEERVLTAVTERLGFPTAIVALVDQEQKVITSWLGCTKDSESLVPVGDIPHTAQISLTPERDPITRALAEGRPRLAIRHIVTSDAQVNRSLSNGAFHIFPMILRGHPVGVLLVGRSAEEDAERLNSLHAIASQAAVAMGTTLMCIDRAQRLAIQEERIRIAHEIHDTVSQSLFGMGYTLNACIRLLPSQPGAVQAELINIAQLAETARRELRESIMNIRPAEITADSFTTDLLAYLNDSCRVRTVDLNVSIRGVFNLLPASTRHDLYRIAQEAVTNITRHSVATEATVCLDVAADRAVLSIRDNGQGFDVAHALVQECYGEKHFGLHGIQERVTGLGGSLEILSQPGAGATLLIELPTRAVPRG